LATLIYFILSPTLPTPTSNESTLTELLLVEKDQTQKLCSIALLWHNGEKKNHEENQNNLEQDKGNKDASATSRRLKNLNVEEHGYEASLFPIRKYEINYDYVEVPCSSTFKFLRRREVAEASLFPLSCSKLF